MRVASFLKNVSVVVVATALTFIFLEIGIRLFPVGVFRQYAATGAMQMHGPDPVLGHRPNPKYPGHDERGWRNEKALESAEIVVLGDSQTYGINAERDESWPRRLEQKLGRGVYQMAFGGFGPAHYVQLLDEVLNLNPRLLVIGIYFGNDILDSYWLTYPVKTPEYQRSRHGEVLDGFMEKDPVQLKRFADLERVDPFHRRHSYLDCQSPRPVPDPALQEVFNLQDIPRPGWREDFEAGIGKIKQFVKRSWLVLATLETWRNQVKTENIASADTAPAPIYPPPICLKVESRGNETILSPAYRLVTLVDSDPRVVEGERLSVLSIQHINRRIRDKGIPVFWVMIPTKELVYKNAIGTNDFDPDDISYLTRLWRFEEAMRVRIGDAILASGGQVIDTLPALRQSLQSESNPYSANADGHPNSHGYEVIAREVASRLPKPLAKR